MKYTCVVQGQYRPLFPQKTCGCFTISLTPPFLNLLPPSFPFLCFSPFLDVMIPSHLTAAWLAQLGERRRAEREVAGSNPGRTNPQGPQITERKVLSLKRRSCLIAISLSWFLWDVKEPTCTTVRKEQGAQTPVVWPTFPRLGGLSVRRDLNRIILILILIGITS